MAYYNEIDPFCCGVLKARIADGRLPGGQVDGRDVREVRPDEIPAGQVHLFAGIGGFAYAARLAGLPDDFDIWTAGFPCQDISTAGKGAGLSAPRSGLWREVVRCLRVVRPPRLLVENVAALLGRGMGTVLGDLAGSGYDAEWDCLPASTFGARHLRCRVFISAHAGILPDADPFGRIYSSQRHTALSVFGGFSTPEAWPGLDEPELFGDLDGIPGGLDFVQQANAAYGNAIVPQVAAKIMRTMTDLPLLAGTEAKS